MPDYSMNDIVLVRYPFSNLQVFKVRPAIIVSAPHISQDVFIVPLTSQITDLLPGEFVLENWKQSGLNVASAVKRGIYIYHSSELDSQESGTPCTERSNDIDCIFAKLAKSHVDFFFYILPAVFISFPISALKSVCSSPSQ